MHILKIFIATLFAAVLLLLNSNSVSAQEDSDFVVDAVTSYTLLETGSVRVKQDITLINTKEFIYAPTYSISLTLNHIENIQSSNAQGDIPFTLQEDGQTKNITIEFPDRVVGIDKRNSFSIVYETTDYARSEGGNYTISIPPISNSSEFRTYEVLVAVPENFNDPHVVKPLVDYKKNENVYIFSKDQVSESGVVLIFGDKQYYRFKLSYNLENNNLFPVVTEVAIPANTAYQNVILEKLSPKPQSVSKDKDGNVLAKYSLKQKSTQRIDAVVLVETSLTPKSQKINSKERSQYLRSQKYWEVKNSEVQKVARELENVQDIYDYVVKALSYDSKKTGDANERLGAVKALQEPFFAVCLEFTDLFVALARAKGIPARSVEGFAYTENETLRPVSLFEDVLHAWPEYYDDEKQTWIMVDPTWGDTTGGVDFFHTFDLDHVAFVKNGLSSTYPVPAGGYKLGESQDIQMEFVSAEEFKKVDNPIIGGSFSSFVSHGRLSGAITFLNLGNHETTPGEVFLYLNGEKTSSVHIPSAPPLGSSQISIQIPLKKTGFLTNISHTITMQDGNGKKLYSKTIHVFPFPISYIIGGVVFSGFIILFIIAIKTRSLSIFRRKK